MEMAEGVDVRLLHHVFGVGLLHDRAGDAVDALVVPPHQDLEQRRLAGADSRHYIRVAQARGVKQGFHVPLESSLPRSVASSPVVTFSAASDSIPVEVFS